MTRTRIAVSALLAFLLIAAIVSVQSLLAVASGPETPSSYTWGPGIKARAAERAQAFPHRLATAAAIDYGSGLWGGTTSPVHRTGDPATAAVTMIGDSITDRCTPDLVAAFAAKGKTLAVIAQSSQRSDGLYLLLSALENIGGTVVFFGGANNVFDPFGSRQTFTDLAAWAHTTETPTYLVDTYVGRPNTLMHDLRNSGQVNGYIYGTGLPVISSVAALTSAVGRAPGMLPWYVQDGVHYWIDAGTGHGDGCAFLSATIANGVK